MTRLGASVQCGGCGAKVAPAILDRILHVVSSSCGASDSVLVGLNEPDDAAVHLLPPGRAVITTADIFPPPVDDPAAFGAICAANAVSDVYAMGGDVHTALIIAAFPREADLDDISQALRAACEVVNECGGTVVGGHTVHSSTPLLGLSVTGSVSPDSIWRRTGGRPGDALVLSKPLGTGMAIAGGNAEAIAEAVSIMRTTNKAAAEQLRQASVHAVTDVTGFGLLGHAMGMLVNGLGATIDLAAVPVLSCVSDGRVARSSAHETNLSFVQDRVQTTWASALEDALVDPQTSGGLLAAVPAAAVADLPGFWMIGRITDTAAIVVEENR